MAIALSSLVLQPRVTLSTIAFNEEQSGALSGKTLIACTIPCTSGSSAAGAQLVVNAVAANRSDTRRTEAAAERFDVMMSPTRRIFAFGWNDQVGRNWRIGGSTFLQRFSKCRREDSNLHSLSGNQVLNLARLPIPPL